MRKIIIESQHEFNLTAYPEFLFLLKNSAKQIENGKKDHLFYELFEMTLNINGDDLRIEIDEKKNDSELLKTLSTYIYLHGSMEVTYKTKNHHGFLSLFEKKNEVTTEVKFIELYKFMKKLPDNLLYEHRLREIILKYLNAVEINDEQLVNLFEIMYAARFFDLNRTNLEDMEVFKLILNC
ncbi:hypothetical protein JV173_00155 [Acholeplasma equirhinis]|uniref:hypothetical protein n=1 Tax=Acholeplasma equirhinis TaxID=555393 RepID=UPI00197A8053|nr:hypothetical protein [Acholeplasma equirhinis]MBN3489914.1 hypothetical protein [Acholeplasma equirhinis]